MAEHSIEEMRAQAVKAGRYFGKGLKGQSGEYLAFDCGGSLIFVTRADGKVGAKMRAMLEEGGFKIEKPTRYQQTLATEEAKT